MVVGPTAIGKTAWSIKLAKHFKTEIISADSRQFYKEMQIGTAVPGADELSEVPHHFVQHLSISEPWSAGDFERAAEKLLKKLFSTHDVVVAVGGSGLYTRAVAEGLDHFPDAKPGIREKLNKQLEQEGIQSLQRDLKNADPSYFELVDTQNPHRLMRALEVYHSTGLPFSSFLNKAKSSKDFRTIFLGITASRSLVYKRIEERVDQMMKDGLLEEAEKLYPYREMSALQTVGYQELFAYMDGKWDLRKAVEEIKKNTRRYAKRQFTWFGKNEHVLWVQYDEDQKQVISKIKKILLNE